MSAEDLRRAAETLREAALAATPGPWTEHFDEDSKTGTGVLIAGNRHIPEGKARETVEFVGKCWGWGPREQNARLIALLGPDVALAVADWLEVTERETGTSSTAYKSAEAVAALINGGAA